MARDLQRVDGERPTRGRERKAERIETLIYVTYRMYYGN